MAVALLLPALLLGGCGKEGGPGGGGKGAGGPKKGFRVVAAQVKTQPVVYVVETVGGLEADEEVQIPARVAGVIGAIRFAEGDRVQAGDALAEINAARYGLAVDRARAALDRAEAEAREAEGKANALVNKAAADLKEAEDALAKRDRVREKDPGWVTEEELSTYRTRVERAKAGADEAQTMVHAQVEKLRAAAAEAKAALGLAELDARDAVIRAPIPGVINARRVGQGQYVTIGTVVATIVNLESVRLRFQLNETEAAAVAGSHAPTVVFSVRTAGEREFPATLFHVGQVADAATRTVECLARMENHDAQLKPGSFAKVRITLETRQQAVVVPESAVQPTDRGFLAYVADQGTARARELRLGLHTREGEVEVLSGVAAGELLVIRGASVLRDGAPVETITEEEDAKKGN
ncbi:MAG: efflux RND transporter periplasmic adaptor subunit [Planctomycetes bacterium]|nr:efflux RND transporter periplasmic adaptor subunit [Planctomycetota bacterium]